MGDTQSLTQGGGPVTKDFTVGDVGMRPGGRECHCSQDDSGSFVHLEDTGRRMLMKTDCF